MILKECQSCRGCCGSDGYVDILLTQNDLVYIPKRLVKKSNSLWKFKKSRTGVCYFLTAKGCSLAYKKRPLDCRIYPLTFVIENSKIQTRIFRSCPLAGTISKEILAEMKKELRRGLKQWQPEEIVAYAGSTNTWAWLKPE